MPIKLENVGIAVRDIEATIEFFTDLGLELVGRDTISGDWADTAVGLDGNHAKIAVLKTPDGHGQLELFEYIHPVAIETEPTLPNHIGMHRVAFSVDDIDAALGTAARHGYHPLRGVATYQDLYKLTYVRGPSGILVMLAEEPLEGLTFVDPHEGEPLAPTPVPSRGSAFVRSDGHEAITERHHHAIGSTGHPTSGPAGRATSSAPPPIRLSDQRDPGSGYLRRQLSAWKNRVSAAVANPSTMSIGAP